MVTSWQELGLKGKNVVLKNIMENRNDDSRHSWGDDKEHLRASFTCSYREELVGQN